MVLAAAAPWPLGLAGPIYGITAAAMSGLFLAMAVQVAIRRSEPDDKMLPEKRLFKYSILYLFIVFGALVVDRWLA
jgi:protoheme IX farnesyltransferase